MGRVGEAFGGPADVRRTPVVAAVVGSCALSQMRVKLKVPSGTVPDFCRPSRMFVVSASLPSREKFQFTAGTRVSAVPPVMLRLKTAMSPLVG